MRKDLFNKQVAQYTTPEVENREELYIDENIRSIIPSMKISGETYQKTSAVTISTPQEIIIAGEKPTRIRVASDNLFDITAEQLYAVDNLFNMGYIPKIENGIIYGGGAYGSSDGAYMCVKVDGRSRYQISYEIEIDDPTTNTVNVRRAALFSDIAENGLAGKSSLFARVSGLKNGAVDFFTVDTYGYEYLGITWFTNKRYAFKVKNLTITKCKNYFDITKVTGANRVDRLPAVGSADFGTVENNILHMKYGSYSLGTGWAGANINIDHSGNYHLSLDVYVSSTLSELNYVPRTRLYNATKQTSTGWKIAGSTPPLDTWTHMTITDISVPSGWENDEVFLTLQILGGAAQYKDLPVYAKNVALYGPTRREYEPGYGSNEVEIPTEIELNGKNIPLRFARLEKRDIEDELIIDSAQQKVKYIQRLGYYEPIAADGIFIYTTNKHILFHGALDKAYNRAYGLSTHNSIVGGWSTAVNALWIGAGGNRNIVWYGAFSSEVISR